MAQTAEKLATYDDLLAAPENQVAEIIYGQLHTTPRPAPRHALASSNMGIEVGSRYNRGQGGPGGWIILDEPELHLGAHVLVPDLAGWRRERMPELPETAWFELPPDWVCEILSPSTASIDRSRKMPIYAEAGVSWNWLVDPDIRTLEAYELHDGQWVLLKTLCDDAEVALAPFDVVPFPLDALWA